MHSTWQKLGISGRVASCIVLLYVMMAVLGPLVAPDPSPAANRQLPELAKMPPLSRVELAYYCPNQQTNSQNCQWRVASSAPTDWQRQNVTFWLGTDHLGRDVLSRMLLGGRVSLAVGFMAVLLSLALGLCLGLVSGYFGGWVDACAQWLFTVVWSIPSVLTALAISYIMGKGLLPLSLAIGFSLWVDLARVVRNQTLVLRNATYIQAARGLGLHPIRIFWVHILPNLMGPVFIYAAANFSTAVLLEAGLSFLGLGVKPPTPSWGNMMAEGYPFLLLDQGQGMAVFPGLAMVILILSCNLAVSNLKQSSLD